MTKVKFFSTRQHRYMDLEKSINEWLGENPTAYIKDIKLVSAPTIKVDLDANLILCIIYQEEETHEN